MVPGVTRSGSAPGRFGGAFAPLTGLYRGVKAKLGAGGKVTFSDIDPVTHRGVATRTCSASA